METHVWHAKRFAMVDRWGFRLPERSRDKAARTVYRLSQRDGACITDQSYYRTISVTHASGLTTLSDTLSLKHDPSKLQLRHLTTDSTPLCPVSILTLSPHETLIFVHPSAFPTVLAFLSSQSIPFEERCLNQYLILSQLVGLQHLYNVCAPLAADEESRVTMEAIKDMKFDSSQIDPQQVIVLNLKRDMLDEQFKMNERVFSYQLSSNAELNNDEKYGKELYRDHTKT